MERDYALSQPAAEAPASASGAPQQGNNADAASPARAVECVATDAELQAAQPPAVSQTADDSEDLPEIAVDANRQQSGVLVDPADASQEASHSAGASRDGAAERSIERPTAHDAPSSAERGAEASEPDRQRVEDGWHDVNNVATSVASDAREDADGDEVAPVMPEQPVDDAPSTADTSQARTDCGFLYAPSCYLGCIRRAMAWKAACTAHDVTGPAPSSCVVAALSTWTLFPATGVGTIRQ